MGPAIMVAGVARRISGTVKDSTVWQL